MTPDRFAQGMRYDEYVAYIATPENLRREGTGGTPRTDRSAYFRDAFKAARLNDDQSAAFKWLVAQPGGPARMLVISEEWSSDCRRDVPTFARIAADTGMELRVFTRDAERFSSANVPDPSAQPNADLVSAFLNHKEGRTYQSIPVCAFFASDMTYLYHFTEYAAIYDKERVVVQHIRAPRPGETADQTRERSDREFGALVNSPFFRIWASAAVDEIISALHRKAVLGEV